MAHLPADALRRPLALGGGIAWLMVGVPVLVHGAISAARLVAWGAAWVSFLVAAWGAHVLAEPRARLGLLALATGAVVAMVLLLCDGFEGALLVLVALELGGLVSRRAGVGWIVAASALLAGAISLHWSPSPALLLTPPYLGFQLLAFLVADLLARSDAARAELARANRELALAQRTAVEASRLAERLRIARDLHDAVGHRLTALSLNLEVAVRLADGSAKEPIEAAHALAKGALGEVRTVVERLHDDERIDLSLALRTLAAEIPAPRVHLAIPEGLCPDDGERALTLLRCTQEILTNAVRHAAAANVWIDITELPSGALELRARDDGAGTDALLPGRGLRGMKERVEQSGGRLEIDSRAGVGFTLHATLPPRLA